MNPEVFLGELQKFDINELETFNKRIVEQKYYSSQAAPFLTSRVLNYWIEENNLLEKWDEKGRRRFSFAELVWLKIINDLRNFGISIKVLKRLKDDLFTVTDFQNIVRTIQHNRKEIEKMVAKLSPGPEKKLAEFVLKVDEFKEFPVPSLSPLYTYIMSSVFFRTAGSLIINEEGDHMFVTERHLPTILKNEGNRVFFRKSHVSISLTEIIEFFIVKERIDPDLETEIFSKDEFRIIEIIRKEKPDSLIVKFDNNRKINLIEVVKNKTTELAHRLSDIILRDGYEVITLKTQKGKIVTCTSSKKIKP